MGRYEKEHGTVDLGIPLIPLIARKTVITDTKTGDRAEGIDWDSYKKSDSKAWANLTKLKENR